MILAGHFWGPAYVSGALRAQIDLHITRTAAADVEPDIRERRCHRPAARRDLRCATTCEVRRAIVRRRAHRRLLLPLVLHRHSAEWEDWHARRLPASAPDFETQVRTPKLSAALRRSRGHARTEDRQRAPPPPAATSSPAAAHARPERPPCSIRLPSRRRRGVGSRPAMAAPLPSGLPWVRRGGRGRSAASKRGGSRTARASPSGTASRASPGKVHNGDTLDVAW